MSQIIISFFYQNKSLTTKVFPQLIEKYLHQPKTKKIQLIISKLKHICLALFKT